MRLKRICQLVIISACVFSLPIYFWSGTVLAQNEPMLFFQPDIFLVAPGNTVSVDLMVDTLGQPVKGIDALIKYDAAKLRVTGIAPNRSFGLPGFAPIVSGTGALNFDIDLSKAVDEHNSIIRLGAVAYDFLSFQPAADFKGSGRMATVSFEVLPVRTDSAVSFSYISAYGNLADANVFSPQGLDFLDEGNVGQAQVSVQADEVCRAAVDLSDPAPGLNDILQIGAKLGNACQGCAEDANRDGMIDEVDLQFVSQYSGQSCPVTQ